MLVIIQARTSSKRFKDKVLFNIYGKPLILHVIEKIKKSNKIDIIVSTSKKKGDDTLVKLLIKNKIKFFRGSLNNVAKRLYETAIFKNQKFFLRVSADSPLIDFQIINKIINIHKKNKSYDLITNIFPKTFPSGQSVEIIKTKTLGKNLKFFSRLDKEHVTRYFYENPSKFKIKNFLNKNSSNLRKLSIDSPNDLKIMLKLYNKKKFLNFKYLNEKN